MKNNYKSEIISAWPNSNVYIEYIRGKSVISKEYYDEIARALDEAMVINWTKYNYDEYKEAIKNEVLYEDSEYKNYHVSKRELQKYHKIQSKISKLNLQIDFWDKYNFVFMKNHRNEIINKLIIKVLDIWDVKIKKTQHIKIKQNVYITNPEPIFSEYEWKNIDYRYTNWDWLLEYYDFGGMCDWEYYLWKAIGAYFREIWILGEDDFVSYKNNFKIMKFENGVMEVMITDIWINIKKFVKQHYERIMDKDFKIS